MEPLHFSGLADILALADLISGAVKDVVGEYTAAQVRMPALSSTSSGPFDAPESASANLLKAIRMIEAACTQLSFTVASPGHVICQKSFAIHEQVCMLVATDSKIADHLLDKPDGLHVDELSQATGIDPGKLGRVLRLLATKHCFTEVKPDVFANNRLSIKLLSTDPVSGLVGHLTDDVGLACTALNEILKDPKTTVSLSPKGSAFDRAYGCSVLSVLEAFCSSLVGWGQISGKGMLSKVYPLGSLPHDAVFCDVGGNTGHASIDVLRAFPHLKIVVHDLPEVVKQGQEVCLTRDLDATAKERVQWVPLDFFNETPVKGCDVYYLRHILHDWPAAECEKILGGIRKVVKPTSRLLIRQFSLYLCFHPLIPCSDEIVLQHLAPEPLLPNFGAAKFRPYAEDINMMVALNSQERTLSQFISIGLRFRIMKLWDVGETSLVEFRPSESWSI
ncbi:S-adenosyl-L-methionine-dependent methyltransferase [Mycena haematopus]|nr:S-adenosyl-L-methionine-dependent methyltransferase [Mycena haematopus]